MFIKATSQRQLQMAHFAVSKAIKAGRLCKPDRCSSCRKVKRVVAHHEDYNKQLEVIWLCRKCHVREHYKSGFSNVTKLVRIEDDVVTLLERYYKQFPMKSTTPQQVNGFLRDALRDKLSKHPKGHNK